MNTSEFIDINILNKKQYNENKIFNWCKKYNHIPLIIGSLIIVIILVFLPVWIAIWKPTWINEGWSTLFNGVLAFSSISASYIITKIHTYSESTSKWLKAAETALRQLIVLEDSLNRMMVNISKVSISLERLMSKDSNKAGNNAISELVSHSCEQTQDRLIDLYKHVRSAEESWKMFITDNCTYGECYQTFVRLNKFREELSKGDIKINFSPLINAQDNNFECKIKKR